MGLALLGGIGFTVALLIGELAYGMGTERDGHVKLAVLTGSLLAAVLAAVVLGLRNRTYRHLQVLDRLNANHDNVPDAHQPNPIIDPRDRVHRSPRSPAMEPCHSRRA